MVVCEFWPQRKDPNHTRITVAGGRICYPGNIGTPTGSIELAKLTINSVLSCRNAHFVYVYAKKFYLQTSMDWLEYVYKKLSEITQEFIQEYNLTQLVQNGWIYFQIIRGWYGLP